MAVALIIIGAALLVAAAYLVSVPAGLAVGGALLLVAGVDLARAASTKDRP